MPDDIATEAQPDLAAVAASTREEEVTVDDAQGQDQDSGTSGLYSLDTVPEELREQVTPIFKDWEANVTREFQKRAEQLKPFEPFSDIPAEELPHLRTFYDLASDPDSFKAWVRDTAEKLGVLGEVDVEDDDLEDEDGDTPDGVTQAGMTPEQIREQIRQEMQAEREEHARQQQMQETQEQVARTVREKLDAFKKEFGNDEDFDEELVCHFAQRHMDPSKPLEEVLQAGYADFARRFNKAASDALDKKLSQPASTQVVAGQAATAPSKAASIDDAANRLRERLRAANAQ